MRLHFVVEGQTEETFVREILAPELGVAGIYCDAHSVTTGRKSGKVYRGGLLSYAHLRRDLDLWMKQDRNPDSWFTTMIDVYGLPSDFPSIAKSRRFADPFKRTEFLEQEFSRDLPHPRFVPYLQLHEFEALLFSAPQSFSIAFPSMGMERASQLQVIRDAFETPEHIDEGHDTAPSKRIMKLLPEYDKQVSGPLIAKEAGLAKLRSECHRFNAWLVRLEAEAGGAAHG